MHRYLLLKQLMLIVLMEQLLLLDHQCASVPVVEAVDVNSVDGAVCCCWIISVHRYLLLKQLMLIVLMEQLLLLDHQCASVPVLMQQFQLLFSSEFSLS